MGMPAWRWAIRTERNRRGDADDDVNDRESVVVDVIAVFWYDVGVGDN